MNTSRSSMAVGLRNLTYVVFTGVWVTGCAWLVLHEFCEAPGEFGSIQHPWEPSLLLAHGLTAVVSVYLLGWLTAVHVVDRWQLAIRRASGASLLIVVSTLMLTGFALFFLTADRWREWITAAHEIIGVGATVFAVEHWIYGRMRTS